MTVIRDNINLTGNDVIFGINVVSPQNYKELLCDIFIGGGYYRTEKAYKFKDVWVFRFEPIARCLCLYADIKFIINQDIIDYTIKYQQLDDQTIKYLKDGTTLNIQTNESYKFGFIGICNKLPIGKRERIFGNFYKV